MWLRDIDRLHTVLATYGDEAADAVTALRPIEGDSTGQPDARSSPTEHSGQPSLSHDQLSLDLPSPTANRARRFPLAPTDDDDDDDDDQSHRRALNALLKRLLNN